MPDLATTAPAFVEMAHRIVWASVATVDGAGRPRSRVLHPIWTWEDGRLTGWVGTSPTPVKRAHLAHSPYASVNYWSPDQDTCVAECEAEWADDVETRTRVWNLLKSAPEPLGYDPGGIGVSAWQTPESPGFTALRLTPWRLRVMPGSLMRGEGGEILTWQRAD
ncbi:pyridoxamine 5'-phosphate oxidase family protein [Streptomyces sp. 71268]|uniref:pyridoxamine 5'-phosphate oxidase family protein n=1 Tax=Streptomyces sp. 71268 TaxID=3002640 RepID=UPI0023F9D8AB|nr:pyridoxamine 5'-phosphate oxidase family protein [Streptomyces sp. 71268]WEV23955.1 pyridoxamine 5'-phosphate oxidase family protein [Streptomyces sp. 71268]